MYILDTNAFYYAAGFSNFSYDVERLQRFIDSNEIILSTTSLFEFFTKNRNNIDIIREGGKYLREKNIRIASNKINPLPTHFVDDIEHITLKQFQLLIPEILKNKIDVESRFTALLFDLCVFAGYYFIAMSDGKEPCEYCFASLQHIYKILSSTVLNTFQTYYTEGYSTNNCETYLRDKFYSYLSTMLELGIPFIEKAKMVKSDEDYLNVDGWFSSEYYSKQSEIIASKINKKTSISYLHRLGVAYKKSNNDPELKTFIQNVESRYNKRITLQALREYYYDTLYNILVCSAALHKNDLLDAIILCNTQDGHKLITYDTNMIKRMERYQYNSLIYKESLKTISDLKQ